MPEQRHFEVKAHELRRGDVLTHADAGDVVTGKTRLGKPVRIDLVKDTHKTNVLLTTDAGRVVVRRGAVVDVTRAVKTDAEQRVEREAALAHEYERTVTDWTKWADYDPRAFLSEKLDGYANDVAAGLAWYVPDAMTMSHRRSIGVETTELLERHGGDHAAVFDTVMEHARSRVINMARWLENSTSPTHNLSKRIELQVWATLVDDAKWVEMLRRSLDES